MSDNDDKRKFTRVNVDFQVSVSSGGKSPIEGTSRDISMGGLFIETSKGLPVGADCDATVPLGGGSEPVKIQCRGTVNRSTPGRHGGRV